MARRRSRRAKRQSRQAILNFVLAGIAVAIIGFSFFALQPEPYDEVPLCVLSDDLPPHTAVIIDKPDGSSKTWSCRKKRRIALCSKLWRVSVKPKRFQIAPHSAGW